jgi:hypothetical protein
MVPHSDIHSVKGIGSARCASAAIPESVLPIFLPTSHYLPPPSRAQLRKVDRTCLITSNRRCHDSRWPGRVTECGIDVHRPSLSPTNENRGAKPQQHRWLQTSERRPSTNLLKVDQSTPRRHDKQGRAIPPDPVATLRPTKRHAEGDVFGVMSTIRGQVVWADIACLTTEWGACTTDDCGACTAAHAGNVQLISSRRAQNRPTGGAGVL